MLAGPPISSTKAASSPARAAEVEKLLPADTEFAPPRAGDHHHRHRRVVVGLGQRIGHVVVEGLVEGVQCVGSVQGERADPVRIGDGEHRRSLPGRVDADVGA